MHPVVTALFVPGSRPDRFSKALNSGADAIVIDLEDAVAFDAKDFARKSVEEWLVSLAPSNVNIFIRVNSVHDHEFNADALLLKSLSEQMAQVDAVVVPKTESQDDLDAIAGHGSPDLQLIPLIESARGITKLEEIAEHPRVTQISFGAADFSSDVACALDEESLLYARSKIVVASAAHGLLPPLDSPCFETSIAATIEKHSQHGRKLGFGGSLCIHPFQIRIVENAYLPNEAELLWAQNVLSSSDSNGVSRVGTEMIDEPIRRRAQQLLDRQQKRESI